MCFSVFAGMFARTCYLDFALCIHISWTWVQEELMNRMVRLNVCYFFRLFCTVVRCVYFIGSIHARYTSAHSHCGLCFQEAQRGLWGDRSSSLHAGCGNVSFATERRQWGLFESTKVPSDCLRPGPLPRRSGSNQHTSPQIIPVHEIWVFLTILNPPGGRVVVFDKVDTKMTPERRKSHGLDQSKWSTIYRARTYRISPYCNISRE